MVAELFSALYAFIMMVVLVGSIITAAQESPFHPSVIFLASMVFIFAFAAILHPWEWTCIIYGALYFLCVPSGFLLLVIYSLVNLHDISWGTREIPQKKTKEEIAEEERKKKEKEETKKQGWLSRLMPKFQLTDLKGLLDFSKSEQREEKTIKLLEQMNKNIEKLIAIKSENHDIENAKVEPIGATPKKRVSFLDAEEEFSPKEEEETDENIAKKKTENKWTRSRDFRHGHVIDMNEQEIHFWKRFIDKYLGPIEISKDEKQKTSNELKELRNNVVSGFCFINLIWIAINFMFQLRKPAVITLPIRSGVNKDDIDDDVIKIDALGLMFVIFFVLILLIQFIGMIMHRWGTLMHLIANTEIPNPFVKGQVQENEERIHRRPKDIVRLCQVIADKPMPDYPSDDEEKREEERIEIIRNKIQNFSIHGVGENLRESQKSSVSCLSRSYRNCRSLSRSREGQGPSRLQSTLHSQTFQTNAANLIARTRRVNMDSRENRSEFRPNVLRHRRGYQFYSDIPQRSGPGNASVVFKELEKEFKDRKLNEFIIGVEDKPKINYGASGNPDDNIYDEIPAEAGTLSRNFYKTLFEMNPQVNYHDAHTARSRRICGENDKNEVTMQSERISEEVTTAM